MEKDFPDKTSPNIFFVAFLAVLCLGLTNSLAGPFPSHVKNNLNGSQTLIGHVPLEVLGSKAVFRQHTSHKYMDLEVLLPLANQQELTDLISSQKDPNSPLYHHWISSAEYAGRFKPSAINASQVQDFLKNVGLYVTGQSPNGAILHVTGTVKAVEDALNLSINDYQNADGTVFFAPANDPSIPAPLAGKVLAIAGLDNLPKFMAHSHPGVLPMAIGSGPGGYLAPNDVKNAYNLNSVPANGSGQNIALFELDGYSSQDITAYEAKFGLPNVPLQNVLVDGFNGVPNYNIKTGAASEVTLDIELLTAFAPGASEIYVYETSWYTANSWNDEWSRIAADDIAKIVSCSYGLTEQDAVLLNFDDQIFQQMAAQGQAVFVSSGDSGAFASGGSALAVEEPASEPYVTAVGISKLTTNADGTYNSEIASLDGGGGVSSFWSIPSYQTTAALQAVSAAKVSTAMRNLPDVALTADPSTLYSFYINGGWVGMWGSSLSAPIWAAFISRVNQGLGAKAPIGFVNTALYQLAQNSSNYARDFHDISTGNNGYYPAEPGFDDATGLGSFNGLNLYNDLVNNGVPAAPANLTATAGNSQVALSWVLSAGAASYNVKRSTVSGGPYTTISSPNYTSTSYVDNTAVGGITYYYVVSGVNLVGEGPNSPEVNARPISPLPPAPAGLTAATGNAQVSLSWAATVGAASYNVKGRPSLEGSTQRFPALSALITLTQRQSMALFIIM